MIMLNLNLIAAFSMVCSTYMYMCTSKLPVMIMCVNVCVSSSMAESLGDMDDSESNSEASEEEDQPDRRPVRMSYVCLHDLVHI